MVTKNKCMIIAAAPIEDNKVFIEFNPNDYLIICADKGYETAQKFGISPDYIVGDFDSSSINPEGIFENVHVLPVEKAVTDTMYAAMLGLKLGFREFLIVGGTGGPRSDHTIANYNVMLYLSKKGASSIMVDNYTETFLLNGKRLILTELENRTVSIFPFGSSSCNITLKGFKYSLPDGEVSADNSPSRGELTAGGMIMGVSNEINSEKAEIMVHYGNALVIVNNEL